MQMVRQVIVFDAADLHAESAFWAGILSGHVFKDVDWHSVIDASGEWRIGVQLRPNHVPPDWPHATPPQQVHLDLHVDDPRAAHEEAIALGARLLQPAPDFDVAEGHQVYADPAGHPFCIGWGQPSQEALAAFFRRTLGAERAKPRHLRAVDHVRDAGSHASWSRCRSDHHRRGSDRAKDLDALRWGRMPARDR